jgi:hypothetical protein
MGRKGEAGECAGGGDGEFDGVTCSDGKEDCCCLRLSSCGQKCLISGLDVAKLISASCANLLAVAAMAKEEAEGCGTEVKDTSGLDAEHHDGEGGVGGSKDMSAIRRKSLLQLDL